MEMFEECVGDIMAMDSARTIFIRGSSRLSQGSFKKTLEQHVMGTDTNWGWVEKQLIGHYPVHRLRTTTKEANLCLYGGLKPHKTKFYIRDEHF